MNAQRMLPLAYLLLGAAACGSPKLDTRTFELQYLDGLEATQMLDPYVYGDRPGAPGGMTHAGNILTVRETPDNLEKIARVLEDYDKPKPRVQLYFQLIEADGTTGTDSSIADIEGELRKLFRFRGYELVAEAYVGGTEGSSVEQVIGPQGDPNTRWVLSARIHRVRARGDSGIVQMTVGVRNFVAGGIETSINARAGQTVVVGNAQLLQGGGTVILAVRPELVEG